MIDANLIMGNSAESGTGGGLRLQGVNGEDVIAFPTRPNPVTTGPLALRSPGWNNVNITNNIIANNVAGWDGGGVSIQDALKVRFVNNTVVANDTTASAGVLFNTLGAPNTATPPPGCTPQPDPTQPQDPSCFNPVTTSTNQVAGLVTMRHTPNLIAALPPNGPGTQVACPAGYGYGTGGALNDGSCRNVSLPLLTNDLFWQNRAFRIEVGDVGVDQQNQQAVVTLVPSLDQPETPAIVNGLITGGTGACVPAGTDNGAPGSGGAANYWDIGVRGDTSPAPNSGSGFALAPAFSIMTSIAGYTGAGLLSANPAVIGQYCNGSRLPPEGGGLFAGFNAPPGRSETTGLYPVFALNQVTPAATVDEGNNWINLSYGPLALSNSALYTAPNMALALLGNYSIQSTSPAASVATSAGAPNSDFFGNVRPQGAGFDIGAVEIAGVGPTVPTLTVLDFFNRGNASTLGANWSQPTTNINFLCALSGVAAPCANLRVNNQQALSMTLTGLFAYANWNGAGSIFGNRQAAAFTFVTAAGNETALTLKQTGGTTLLPTNFVRVLYTTAAGGTITIQTTTSSGVSYTTAGTPITGFGGLSANDTLVAFVDQNGVVYVWQNTTFIGSRTLPSNALWTSGGGRIGMQMPSSGTRVDNFAGGTVP